jgi:hypothetical protein
MICDHKGTNVLRKPSMFMPLLFLSAIWREKGDDFVMVCGKKLPSEGNGQFLKKGVHKVTSFVDLI